MRISRKKKSGTQSHSAWREATERKAKEEMVNYVR
jgi:hypothetical protein